MLDGQREFDRLMVMSKERAALVVDVRVDYIASWRPHVGYMVYLEGEAEKVKVPKIEKPAKIDLTKVEDEDIEEAWAKKSEAKKVDMDNKPSKEMEENWIVLDSFKEKEWN